MNEEKPNFNITHLIAEKIRTILALGSFHVLNLIAHNLRIPVNEEKPNFNITYLIADEIRTMFASGNFYVLNLIAHNLCIPVSITKSNIEDKASNDQFPASASVTCVEQSGKTSTQTVLFNPVPVTFYKPPCSTPPIDWIQISCDNTLLQILSAYADYAVSEHW